MKTERKINERECGVCSINVFPRKKKTAYSNGNKYIHEPCGRAYHVLCLEKWLSQKPGQETLCPCTKAFDPKNFPKPPLKTQFWKKFEWGCDAAPDVIKRILTVATLVGLCGLATTGNTSAAVMAGAISAGMAVTNAIANVSIFAFPTCGIVTLAVARAFASKDTSFFILPSTITAILTPVTFKFFAIDGADFAEGNVVIARYNSKIAAFASALFAGCFVKNAIPYGVGSSFISCAIVFGADKLGEKIGQLAPVQALFGCASGLWFLGSHYLSRVTRRP